MYNSNGVFTFASKEGKKHMKCQMFCADKAAEYRCPSCGTLHCRGCGLVGGTVVKGMAAVLSGAAVELCCCKCRIKLVPISAEPPFTQKEEETKQKTEEDKPKTLENQEKIQKAICDVCSKATSWQEGTIYPANEFQQLISKGFEPDDSALSMLTIMGMSRKEAIAEWKIQAIKSTTGWLLCPSCNKKAVNYKLSSPSISNLGTRIVIIILILNCVLGLLDASIHLAGENKVIFILSVFINLCIFIFCWLVTVRRVFTIEGGCAGVLSLIPIISYVIGLSKMSSWDYKRVMIIWTTAIICNLLFVIAINCL